MPKVNWELTEPLPDPIPPPGGWHEITCTFESHKWELTVEDGYVSVQCTDPCDDPFKPKLFDPSKPAPICLHDWQPEDFFTPEPIPVTCQIVHESTPSTPAGPAEYSYYIEVRVAK